MSSQKHIWCDLIQILVSSVNIFEKKLLFLSSQCEMCEKKQVQKYYQNNAFVLGMNLPTLHEDNK